MIREGNVRVNGVIIDDPLHGVSNTDHLAFGPKVTTYGRQLGVVRVNKPVGVWTNCKQGDNQTQVIDILPKKYANYSSIGRLDKASEGLILFTNDGVLANQFLNASQRHKRVYSVWTRRPLTDAQCRNMMTGVQLEDGVTQPCVIQKHADRHYKFELYEGRNRQIRRMVKTCGTDVVRLKRLVFSTYQLGDLEPGDHRFESRSDDFFHRVQGSGIPICVT